MRPPADCSKRGELLDLVLGQLARGRGCGVGDALPDIVQPPELSGDARCRSSIRPPQQQPEQIGGRGRDAIVEHVVERLGAALDRDRRVGEHLQRERESPAVLAARSSSSRQRSSVSSRVATSKAASA